MGRMCRPTPTIATFLIWFEFVMMLRTDSEQCLSGVVWCILRESSRLFQLNSLGTQRLLKSDKFSI